MKSMLQRAYQNRYFLLFILLFAYVQSIYIRIMAKQEINIYTFTPEAALANLFNAGILFLIILYFIRKYRASGTFGTALFLRIFGTSLLIYVGSMKLIGLMIALAFDTVERNFNPNAFTLALFSDFLDGIIYGGFFLAYYYYHHNKSHYHNVIKYNDAWAKSKINQLKAQLNPHFLFNNLNVLDQLIEEDKERASFFLNELAEIYRYVLRSSEKELVTLDEEIDFAQQYFNLITYRYGAAYQLELNSINSKGSIVPLTLQLLIENAVQHNYGTTENPVVISIKIDAHIEASNNKNVKRNFKRSSGLALKNLNEQYQILIHKSIEIDSSDKKFSIIIPIIHPQDL